MKVVFANTIDEDKPSGGLKQAYRHIDILNQLGIDAYFAHPTPGFRYTWFQNNTRTVHSDSLELTADDFIIFGELVHEVPRIKGWERCGKVIVCQNDYNALTGFKMDLMNIRCQFREAAAVLCSSENSERNLRFMFPSARVVRFRYSFDREPFGFCGDKERVVAAMPRKRGNEIAAVTAITQLKWVPAGWNLFKLDGASEVNVANTLKRCAVFISLSEREGFGMPPAEAMACGCVVVGYTGYAGNEFMLPGISFPVADGDFIGLSRELLGVFATPFDEIVDMGHKASTYIRSTYSTEAEVDSIKKAWDKITRPVIDLRTETCDRMRNEVAAYMPVYNEGPYMETLLRWLVPRVGAIYVAESVVPWSPNAKPGGESKAVVDKVLADIPDAKNIIHYIPVGDENDKDKPLLREANQRNEIIEKIQNDGFKFVWMVEADEFYRNDEAEALWTWFFERAAEGARTANCRWHTYWRSPHWRIEPAENFRPNVAYLSSCRFVNGRILSTPDEITQVEVPDRVCIVRHYSWARTPTDVRKKLSAWGHSKETKPEWYDKVFMAWKPGLNGHNVHPTNPESYKSIVRCDLPVPEAMKGHPFLGREIIEDGDDSPVSSEVLYPEIVKNDLVRHKIKAVIMHYNKPENADRLYEQLAPVFDDVEIFDNGSDSNKIPIHTTRSRENVYWTGTWNEVMATCSGYDAVWVLGCDIELKNKPKEYRDAIEASLPFGCWSPCIDGRAHPFMQAEYFKDHKPLEVKNIEGMALAVSGNLMRQVGELVPGSTIGYGQDFWLCYRARKAGMRNIIDGRVSVHHPEGQGYNDVEALRQMFDTFGKAYGADFRRTIFEYDERFGYNLIGGTMDGKRYTIVTVDNGWGLAEFIRVTSKLGNTRCIVMMKGVIESVPNVDGVEFIPYDESLEPLINIADVAFFPRVGAANKRDYLKFIESGVAVVVRESCAYDAVEHMKTGWLFRDEQWAMHWLSYHRDNPQDRERLRASKEKNQVVVKPSTLVRSTLVRLEDTSSVKVTVITPTYQRHPDIIRRSLGSMLLQTEGSWEQLVCSDGGREQHVFDMVSSIADSRIRYTHTTVKKEGDFGNTVRSEMLKQAKGKYVLFLDDDNVILPNYLETMVAKLENAPDCEFTVCKIMHFGPLNEKEIGRPPKVLTGDPVKLYHIDPLQVLVRRDIMQKIGWDTDVGYLSDGVTLEKLASFKCVRVDQVLGIHM